MDLERQCLEKKNQNSINKNLVTIPDQSEQEALLKSW